VHPLNLSCQPPGYRAAEQERAKVEQWLEIKFPKMQRLAEKLGAAIAWEDEAGVGSRTRSGRPGGAVGQPPKVTVSDPRGGDNGLSIVTAHGAWRYSVEAKSIHGER
jgi:hypothetical protein